MLERLNNSQLRKFKAAAQLLEPMLKVGKAGLSEGFLRSVDTALSQHELVKIKFAEFKEQKKELAPLLAEKTSSHLIMRVGNVLVLHRPVRRLMQQSLCQPLEIEVSTMIKLLPLDESLLSELLRDPETRLAEIVSNGPDVKPFLLPVLQQTREFYQRTNCPPPWHGYLGIESEAKRLVGICAFKGKPNEAGELEIAYGTTPGLEGRSHATHMAAALVKLAFESPAVRRVIAHTLPEPNASGRVLQKAGLTWIGEVIDPEDGKVWRWEIGRPDL